MAKVVAIMSMSLDGYVADPNDGHGPPEGDLSPVRSLEAGDGSSR